jgi:hypothetical protein
LIADGRADPAANNNKAIRSACKYGHIEVLKILLSDKRTDPSCNNNQCVRRACKRSYLEMVKLLIEHPRVLETFKIISIDDYPIEAHPYIQKFCYDPISAVAKRFQIFANLNRHSDSAVE